MARPGGGDLDADGTRMGEPRAPRSLPLRRFLHVERRGFLRRRPSGFTVRVELGSAGSEKRFNRAGLAGTRRFEIRLAQSDGTSLAPPSRSTVERRRRFASPIFGSPGPAPPLPAHRTRTTPRSPPAPGRRLRDGRAARRLRRPSRRRPGRDSDLGPARERGLDGDAAPVGSAEHDAVVEGALHRPSLHLRRQHEAQAGRRAHPRRTFPRSRLSHRPLLRQRAPERRLRHEPRLRGSAEGIAVRSPLRRRHARPTTTTPNACSEPPWIGSLHSPPAPMRSSTSTPSIPTVRTRRRPTSASASRRTPRASESTAK